jgi:chemotaxis signal transduction protein
MMLVLALHGWRVACRVDAAEGVTEFDRSSLVPVPATLDGARRAYVNGIFPSHNAQDIAWLNVDSLFNAFEAATR